MTKVPLPATIVDDLSLDEIRAIYRAQSGVTRLSKGIKDAKAARRRLKSDKIWVDWSNIRPYADDSTLTPPFKPESLQGVLLEYVRKDKIKIPDETAPGTPQSGVAEAGLQNTYGGSLFTPSPGTPQSGVADPDLHDAFRGPLSPPPPDVDVGKIQGSDPAGDGAQSDRIPPAPKSPLSKTPRSGDDPSVVNQSGPVAGMEEDEEDAGGSPAQSTGATTPRTPSPDHQDDPTRPAQTVTQRSNGSSPQPPEQRTPPHSPGGPPLDFPTLQPGSNATPTQSFTQGTTAPSADVPPGQTVTQRTQHPLNALDLPVLQPGFDARSIQSPNPRTTDPNVGLLPGSKAVPTQASTQGTTAASANVPPLDSDLPILSVDDSMLRFLVDEFALHITFRLEPESRWAYYGPFKSDNFKWLAPQASLPRKDIVQAWHTIRPRLVELDEVDIEVGFGHPWTPSTFEPILSCIGDKLEVVNPEGLVWVYPPFPAPSLFQDYYVPLVVRRAKQLGETPPVAPPTKGSGKKKSSKTPALPSMTKDQKDAHVLQCLEQDFGNASFVQELRDLKLKTSTPSKEKEDAEPDQEVVSLDKLFEWVEGIEALFVHYEQHPIFPPPGYKTEPLKVFGTLVESLIHFKKEFTSHTRVIFKLVNIQSVRSRCPAIDKAWVERHPDQAGNTAQEGTVRSVPEPKKWSIKNLWTTLKRAKDEDDMDRTRQRVHASQSAAA